MELQHYQWTSRDKWLYFLSMIPFLVVFIGTAVLLSTYSIWLTILLLFFLPAHQRFPGWMLCGLPLSGTILPSPVWSLSGQPSIGDSISQSGV